MTNSEFKLGNTILGVFLAVVVFIMIWIFGGIAMYYLDQARGLGDSMLQTVFREFFIPGLGGFAAMYAVLNWINNASIKVVFFGFSGCIFIFIGFYLGFVVPIADKVDISIIEVLLSFASMIAAIGGSYYAVKADL